jgi:hypothetical protein
MKVTLKGEQGHLQGLPVNNLSTGAGGRSVHASTAAPDVVDLDEGISRGTGRGRKGGLLGPRKVKSPRQDDHLIPQNLNSVPDDLQPNLLMPYSSIREMLSDSDNRVRGIGLELLALRIAIDVGLRPTGFRLRADKTVRGTQTKLLAETRRRIFSRWTVHCTDTVSDVDVGRTAEVFGLATTMRSDVILMVSTAGFSGPALRFADDVTRTTLYQFIFIDGDELGQYFTVGEDWLAKHLSRWVERTEKIKALDFNGAPEDDKL